MRGIRNAHMKGVGTTLHFFIMKINSKTKIDSLGVIANSEKVFGLSTETSNPPCLIIPKYVGEIADSAFQNLESLEAIYIPDTLKRIGTNAFKGCTSLFTIIVHDSIEVIRFRNERGDMDVTLRKPFSVLNKYLCDGYEARLFKAGEDTSWD